MTNQTTWQFYTGSDEQIAEIKSATNGVAIRTKEFREYIMTEHQSELDIEQYITAYWIIPDDPLREMKVRWAMTGQPVWVRTPEQNLKVTSQGISCIGRTYVTTTPDWNIPNANYSFSPFQE